MRTKRCSFWVCIKAFSILGLFFTSFSLPAKSPATNKKEIEKLISEFEEDLSAPQVDAQKAYNWQQQGDAIFVDVRGDDEQKISKIKGALTQDEFEALKTSQLTGKKVIAYCTIGYRSGKFIESLKEKKQNIEAYNLRGSLLLWVHHGFPIYDSQDHQTKKVHVYGRKWNVLPPDYEGIW